MKKTAHASGFALMLVLWTLAILSAIALTLAASVGTEVRNSQDSWNDLQSERLARSGHELATYLEARGLGTTTEDLNGLAIEKLSAGLKYRVNFEAGSVDLTLEGENGKFDLAAAQEEDAMSFFTAWTGDVSRSREIAASVADWMDTNDDPRPFGAESPWYLSRGYRPRNSGLGTADLSLVKGMTAGDFIPSAVAEDTLLVRPSINQVISAVSTGPAVNPNYALPVVLRSLPAMTQDILIRILEGRQRSIFTSPQDFRERTGIAGDSALLARLTFSRGSAPAILAEARLRNAAPTRKERRTVSIDRRRTVPVRFVSVIEHE